MLKNRDDVYNRLNVIFFARLTGEDLQLFSMRTVSQDCAVTWQQNLPHLFQPGFLGVNHTYNPFILVGDDDASQHSDPVDKFFE